MPDHFYNPASSFEYTNVALVASKIVLSIYKKTSVPYQHHSKPAHQTPSSAPTTSATFRPPAKKQASNNIFNKTSQKHCVLVLFASGMVSDRPWSLRQSLPFQPCSLPLQGGQLLFKVREPSRGNLRRRLGTPLSDPVMVARRVKEGRRQAMMSDVRFGNLVSSLYDMGCSGSRPLYQSRLKDRAFLVDGIYPISHLSWSLWEQYVRHTSHWF